MIGIFKFPTIGKKCKSGPLSGLFFVEGRDKLPNAVYIKMGGIVAQ